MRMGMRVHESRGGGGGAKVGTERTEGFDGVGYGVEFIRIYCRRRHIDVGY